jgi:drug/metabolite transporter (DMT)-like permease
MVLMLVFGTLNTLVLKYQNDYEMENEGKTFNHPFFQTFNMFFGEFTCLIVYFIKSSLAKQKVEDPTPLSPGAELAERKQLKTKINPLLLAIPAGFDFCGSSLTFVALTQSAASVYQMMRGFVVVIAAAMAVLFLGRKQYAHHIISLAIITSGVTMVGLVSISNSGDSPGSKTTGLAIILLLISQLFTGGQFVTEEKLLSGYYLDPLLVVGLEGMWGCIYYMIVLPIFQNVSCDNPNLCNNGVIEDSLAALV